MSEVKEELEQQVDTPIEDNVDLASIESEDELVEQTKAIAEQLKSGEAKEQEPEQETIDESNVTEEQPQEEEAEEAQPQEDSSEDTDVPSTYKLKSKGVEIDVTLDELIEMGNKSLDYTKKTQELAKHRSKVDYMHSNNISMDDLHRLADLKSGKKEVIAQYAKELGVDLYDIDTEKEYTPSPEKAYSEPTEQDIFLQEVSQDAELTQKIKTFSDNIPQDFREKIAGDVNLFKAYVEDIRTGVAEQLKPIADKLSILNPSMSYFDAYVKAATDFSGQVQEPVQEAPVQEAPKQAPVDKSKVGKPSGSKSAGDTSLNIWEDGLSDDALVERVKQKVLSLR